MTTRNDAVAARPALAIGTRVHVLGDPRMGTVDATSFDDRTSSWSADVTWDDRDPDTRRRRTSTVPVTSLAVQRPEIKL